MDISNLTPSSQEAKFLHIPYEERWKALKPIIIPLYLEARGSNGKGLTISQIADFMKCHYQFHGAEKKEIVAAIGKRPSHEFSTSHVKLANGRALDKKQMKRYLSDQIRHQSIDPILPGV
ncbi:hypothetical protein QC764_311020 [Podospora pseudoanserina]|uniref:Clr5 domain-containing protein n=1 Tax=Podospora pseudoanserina TaxID=2609844 RepID=A0ABR0IEJ3_9PEZI|nr:hypothetical protein QC764_311020 [Podospora pseudoanserina]